MHAKLNVILKKYKCPEYDVKVSTTNLHWFRGTSLMYSLMLRTGCSQVNRHLGGLQVEDCFCFQSLNIWPKTIFLTLGLGWKPETFLWHFLTVNMIPSSRITFPFVIMREIGSICYDNRPFDVIIRIMESFLSVGTGEDSEPVKWSEAGV